MKHRFAVLVLAGLEKAPGFGKCPRILSPLMPGSRLQNYCEFLSGSGIPFETAEVQNFSPDRVVDDHTIHFSAILLACRPSEIPPALWKRLTEFSSKFGVSLIADSFLFSDSNFLTPFGIERLSRLPRLSGRILDTERNILYRAVPYPYSPKGLDIGARPALRMFLQNWFSRKVSTAPAAGVEAAHGNGNPAMVSHSFGAATNYFLNFHPAFVLMDGNPMHALLRRLIASNPHAVPVSWALDGIGVLRMDDPGSAERVHLEGFNAGSLTEETWQGIIQELNAEKAHMSVAVVPSWVDDGDAGKGQLKVGGRVVENRTPGAHHPSWEVEYRRKDRETVYDYAGAFRAMRQGVEQGVLSILSHGLTHITPQQDQWLAAQDRFTNSRWYREFSSNTADAVERMKQSAIFLGKYFGVMPETLVPSGHEYTPETPALAGKAGFKFFSARSVFFTHVGKIFENRKIRGVYPEEILEGVALAQAGYPSVIVLHDFDLLENGPARLKEMIQKWRKYGVHSFLPLETVGMALAARLEAALEEDGTVRVEIDFRSCPRVPGKDPTLWLRIGGKPVSVEVNGDRRNEDLKWKDGAALFPVQPAQAVDDRLNLVFRFGEGA